MGDRDREQLADAMVPLAAGATGLAFQLALMVVWLLDRAPAGEILGWTWMAVASGLGLAAAGALFRRHFGRPGPAGIARSTLGFLDVLFVGGAIAGLAAAPPIGLVIGPFFALGFAAGQPLFAALLLAGLLALHSAGALRRRLIPGVDPAPPAWPLVAWAAPFAVLGALFLAGV